MNDLTRRRVVCVEALLICVLFAQPASAFRLPDCYPTPECWATYPATNLGAVPVFDYCPGSVRVQLTWNAPVDIDPDNPIIAYLIQKDTSGDPPDWRSIAWADDTTWIDKYAYVGATLSYRVKVLGRYRQLSSPSNVATIVVPTCTTTTTLSAVDDSAEGLLRMIRDAIDAFLRND